MDEEKRTVGAGPKIRASDAEWCERVFGSRNGGVVFALEALRAQLRRAIVEIRGRLSVNEAKLILDALNGTAMLIAEHADLAGHHVRLNVHDGVEQNRLDEKHEIDTAALERTLGEMTAFQLLALELWAAEFWAGEHNDEQFEREHLALVVGSPSNKTKTQRKT